MRLMKRLGLAVVMVLALATFARADKVVTLKTLVLTDVTTITVTRAGAGWTASAAYTVHDAGGGNTKNGMVAVTLTGPQQITFEAFVTSVLVAAANTQEGL